MEVVTYPYAMRSAWRHPVGYITRLPPNLQALGLIVLAVLAANAVYIVGVGSSDPVAWTASIAHSGCELVCGRPSIDANVGAITQPLGHLAAMDILHGHFPWWNPFEGLGQPLAGEMQSAALFPLTLLLGFPSGLLWVHVVLEAISGISTYFLLRRLSIPLALSAIGGVLFALNGTFAWLANSVVNPLAFLPMLLLGIEMILQRAPEDSRRGWYLAAIALGLSLYSGFPEVAYFNALFALAWTLARLLSVSARFRARALRRVGLAIVVGVALSAAILVPFVDFLKVSFVGGHTSSIDGTWALSFRSIPMLFDPYVYGSIYQNAHLGATWGEVGGYFGASVVVLTIVGAAGRRLRGLRLTLALWTLCALAGAFNLLGARTVWNLLPFVTAASLPRYIMPSCELAVIVLAVFGLADLADHGARAKQRLLSATMVVVVVVSLGVLLARPLNHRLILHGTPRVLFTVMNSLPFVALALLFACRFGHARVIRVGLLSAILVAESLLMFVEPTLAAPTHVLVDEAPIHYLQQHQGEERFVDLSVLYPNWGSQFSLNSLNVIDLPFPESFKDFIQRRLYPGLRPADAFTRDRPTQVVAQEAELATHFRAYENASVKYLLASSSLRLSSQLRALGVRSVFRDRTATVYRLPDSRPFFSAPSWCRVTSNGDNVATVTCSKAATLLRTELSMTGWSATVNEKPASLRTDHGVYQEVSIPAGTSTVRYQFSPPHEDVALTVTLIAGLFLVGAFVVEVRSTRPQKKKKTDPRATAT
jgi:hypothetical protein